MKFIKFGGGLIVTLFLMTLGGSLVWGQSQGTGTIEGTVWDESGGALPGATVLVRNVGTNAARTLISDERGRYQAVALQIGSYEVSAELPGFSKVTVTRIELQVGATATIDLKLKVAAVTENVTVTEEAPIIEPDRTEVTSTVSQKQINELPINGRRWENFVLLTPGVSPDGGFGLISYRGISGLYNNNTIDGADNNQAFFSEARGRTRISYTISQSTVKEFQVGLSNFSAEFGRAAGGTVNAATKSGTNEFHGEGFYFLRDRAFQATNPRVRAAGGEKPPERRQQFGVSLGGPIVKDKLFFFGGYDQQKRNFPGFVLPTTPFAAAPCTAPGCAATIAFLNTLTGPFARRGDNYVGLFKLDWLLNQKHTLTGSYNYHKWDSPNGIQTAAVLTVSTLANGTDGVRTDMLNVKLTSVLTPRTVNEFRFQYGRDFEFQFPNAPGPSVSFTNGVSFGQPNFLPRAAFPNEKRFQFTDNYSFNRGGHSFKAGFDINYVRDLQINLFNGGGVYTYSSLNALAQDCPAQATGCVVDRTAVRPGQNYNNYQQAFDLQGQAGRVFFPTTDWNFYFQDNYRVLSNVNLYLGLRYEYSQLPQPSHGNPAFPLTTRFNKDKNNFGPRFGFSWDIGGAHKTVLRGGYGMYYGRTSNSALANALTNNGITSQGYFMTPTSGGAPVFPNVLAAPPTAGASSQTIQFLAADYVRPLIHSVDLSIEREVVSGLAVSGSYLFSRGLRLPLFRDINLPAPTGTVTYILPDGSAAGTFPLYLGARPNPSVGQQIISESVVNSSYHAFVLMVNKRFSRGVLFSSNFTLAKAIDNGQTSQTFFGGNQPFDANNLHLDKGLSNFDVRKRWVTNFLLTPSIDRFTDNAGARAVFNDWKFSGILTFSDGRPLTGTIAGGLNGIMGFPARPEDGGPTNTSRTNGSGGDDRVPFTARNAFTGTGQAIVDFRMARTFRITEKTRFEFIWEAFNLFNRVNYTSFQTVQYNVDDPRLGTSRFNSATKAATIKLINPNTSFLSPVGVGNTLYGPREFQLGLKYIW